MQKLLKPYSQLEQEKNRAIQPKLTQDGIQEFNLRQDYYSLKRQTRIENSARKQQDEEEAKMRGQPDISLSMLSKN